MTIRPSCCSPTRRGAWRRLRLDGDAAVSSGDDGFLRWSPCEVCGSFEKVVRLAKERVDRDVKPLEHD